MPHPDADIESVSTWASICMDGVGRTPLKVTWTQLNIEVVP